MKLISNSSQFAIKILQAITDLVDSALPSFCHQRQLPCPAQSGSGSGPDGVREQEQEKARISGSAGIADSNTRDPSSTLQACLTPNLLSDIMTDADTSFCRRYTGVDGGSEATKLSTYTFMKEVRRHGGLKLLLLAVCLTLSRAIS